MEIQIQIKNLPQIKAAFNKSPAVMAKNLNTAIKQTVFFIRGEAQRRAPVRSGRLRGSAYTEFQPLRGETGFSANYSLFVHEGSKPHVIEAKGGGLYWKGAMHPVKRVNHPGYKGNPFLQKAVDSSQAQVDRFFYKAVDDTLNEIAKAST